jgi:hypothetical protein
LAYLTLSGLDDPQPNSFLDFIDVITSIIPILTFIVALFWYYRASKNIHSFGAKQVWRPILSVIWWFIPPLCLYLPYDVTQQFWKASNPQAKLTVGIEWKEIPSSNMIKLWWLLLISPLFVGLVFALGYGVGLGFIYKDVESESINQASQIVLIIGILSIALSIVSIISDILFIKIIRQISTWQNQKSTTLV